MLMLQSYQNTFQLHTEMHVPKIDVSHKYKRIEHRLLTYPHDQVQPNVRGNDRKHFRICSSHRLSITMRNLVYMPSS